VTTCTAVCAAGYACPAASTSASPPAAMCASGRYAAAGAPSCSDCVAGQFSTAPAGMVRDVRMLHCRDSFASVLHGQHVITVAAPMSLRVCAGVCCAGSCTLCAVGRYSSTAAAGSCADCPAGKYGSTQGLSVTTCTAVCAAGYACPAASTSASPPAAVCASGRYAAAGATSCSDCVAGQFSTAPAGTGREVRTLHCRDPRVAVAFANVLLGQHVSTVAVPLSLRVCAGVCCAGSCTLCAVGRYSSTAAAGSCTDCPAGKYGSTQGLSVSTCTAVCAAGYACPAASTSASPPAAICASGRYAAAGATSCSDCVAGQFSTAPAGTGREVR
jgi:hypothetical protein